MDIKDTTLNRIVHVYVYDFTKRLCPYPERIEVRVVIVFTFQRIHKEKYTLC